MIFNLIKIELNMIYRYVLIFLIIFLISNLLIINFDTTSKINTNVPQYMEITMSNDNDIANIINNHKNDKFVIWKKTSAGWGNRLMGMCKTVMFAIVFETKILMDHDQYEASFNDPETKVWFNQKPLLKKLYFKSVTYKSFIWNNDTQVTFIPQENFKVIPKEWLNILVNKGIIDKADTFEAFMKVGQFLTRYPSQKLIKEVKNMKATLNLRRPKRMMSRRHQNLRDLR